MKLTPKEYGEIQLALADISAQAHLLTIGATAERDKLYEKIDKLRRMNDTAEIEHPAPAARTRVS